MKSSTIPWVEKYRPDSFDKIILDSYNKQILTNILKKNYFPNLLFYGPPGTGKTTTIINLISAFQKNNNQKSGGLSIHLNASDDRGIDVIRNQINTFVNSKTLFNTGTKFVILDEVDYMTKNAQHAFKYLLQNYKKNVRFCLICNYISRIDDSLQNEFIRLRFNQLPTKDIINFISNISKQEKLRLEYVDFVSIQGLYKSDVRSMINYMQSNKFSKNKNNIIDLQIWDKLIDMIKNKDKQLFRQEIEIISKKYNIEIKNIIKNIFNHIICKRLEDVTPDLLNNIEIIMHTPDPNIDYILNFSIEILFELYSGLSCFLK
jgi:DNA polymerase III delta prime subunit